MRAQADSSALAVDSPGPLGRGGPRHPPHLSRVSALADIGGQAGAGRNRGPDGRRGDLEEKGGVGGPAPPPRPRRPRLHPACAGAKAHENGPHKPRPSPANVDRRSWIACVTPKARGRLATASLRPAARRQTRLALGRGLPFCSPRRVFDNPQFAISFPVPAVTRLSTWSVFHPGCRLPIPGSRRYASIDVVRTPPRLPLPGSRCFLVVKSFTT